ncbi:MFS transporter [Ectobacillus funiculus]|uniref:MFS transporter n=1 Tax=Ectobacillus funiculus TaxID=137993 RepID=UPI003979260B
MNGVLQKLGLDSKMALGLFGVLIFMMGDGLEQGWLSSYLMDHGLTVQESALLFSVYGFAVAIAAWLSGVLAEILGPRKAMIIGLALFVIGTLAFLTVGIKGMNLAIMIPTYSLRGLGYPLFAYSFLVWITYYAPSDKLGTAVGWFWFAFTGGLNVLGAYYSSFALPILGEIHTLWSALIFVALGATIAILLNKEDASQKNNKKFETKAEALKYLTKGITIAFEIPKVGLGGLVRTINTAGAYGFVVFMPTYMMDAGFTRTEWLQIYGALWTTNIVFNLIFGIVGDKLGWRNTVMWFGGVGCAFFTLAFYYVPAFMGANYLAATIAAAGFGACLAGYVPLSALVPSLAPENKGAAMSILSLGAGLSTFVGPAIVGVFIGSLGAVGVIWIYTALYIVSAFLMKFVTLPKSGKVTQSNDLNNIKRAASN